MKALLRPVCWFKGHAQRPLANHPERADLFCRRCGVNFDRLQPWLVPFKEQNLVIAENQPEYQPMPAHVTKDGTVIFCWRMTWAMRVRVLFTGRLWHQVLTFNTPIQPQALMVKKPFVRVKARKEEVLA